MAHHLPCPVTSIFARRVCEGCEETYEDWLHGITEASATFDGNQGTTIIRPERRGEAYIALVQFDTAIHLEEWLISDTRASWLTKLENITVESEEVQSLTGLERWFTLPDRKVSQAPPPWKMAVIIFIGLYPTLLILNPLVGMVTEGWPLPARVLLTLCISVPLMVWFIMPQLTRLFFAWLYPRHRASALTHGESDGAASDRD